MSNPLSPAPEVHLRRPARTCHALGRWTKRLALGALAVVLAWSPALAVNPAPVQLFYMPFPEDQLLRGIAGDRVGRIVLGAVQSGDHLHLDRRGRGRHHHLLRPVGERVRQRHRQPVEPLQRRQPRWHADLGRRQPRQRRPAARSDRPHRRRHRHHPQQRHRHRQPDGDRLRRPRQDRGDQVGRDHPHRLGRRLRHAARRLGRGLRHQELGHRLPRPGRRRTSPMRPIIRCSSTRAWPSMAGEGGATVQIDADANGSLRDHGQLGRRREPLRERRRQRRRPRGLQTTPCRSTS